MKRRLFAAALLPFVTALLALAGLAQGVSGQDAPSVWIDPAGQRIDYDAGTFQVEILLSDLAHFGAISYDINRDGVADRIEESNGLGAYEIVIRFDPTVVSVTGMEAGEFLRSSGRSTTCLQRRPASGEFAIGCVSLGGTQGPNGSGNLAVLTLEPVANGMTYLQLEAGLAGPLGDSIDTTIDSGAVEVFNGPTKPPPATAGPGGNGTPAPTPTRDPGPDNIPGTDDDPPYPPPAATLVSTNGTPGAQGTPNVIGQPTDDGDDPSDPQNSGGDDDDGGGSDTTTWIIVAVVGVIALGVLAAVSRFVIKTRAT